MVKKTILQLCADTGSDTWPYRNDPDYEVITVGADIGVENYHPDRPIHGVVANPVCSHFSRVRRGRPGQNYPHVSDPEGEGMFLVRECQRVIKEANPVWWYGSPWTKSTGLWGEFNVPPRQYTDWADVPKLDLWVRPGRIKPSIVYLHKSAFNLIPEFRDSGMPAPETDAELRSLCSQGFARAFKEVNP